MPERRFLPLAGTAGCAWLATAALAAALELVMVEERGCPWCASWNREVAPAYPNTPEGQAAPLRRIDLGEVDESGIRIGGPVVYTPTFLLVEEGEELDRIEGYPGPDFFWALLGKMLNERETGGETQ